MHFHSHSRWGRVVKVAQCPWIAEDTWRTFVNRRMTQMFSYIQYIYNIYIYRKSSCLHGPRHGVNIQCTMTMHDGTFGHKFAFHLTSCRSGMSGHFWLPHCGPSFKLLQRHRSGCVFEIYDIVISLFNGALEGMCCLNDSFFSKPWSKNTPIDCLLTIDPLK